MAPHLTPEGLQDEQKSTPTSRDPSTSQMAHARAQWHDQRPAEKTSSVRPHQLPSPGQQPEPMAGMKEQHPNESNGVCFFYGSLMDKGNLASVLDLAQEPALRPARIEGYRTMLWGPFPALLRADNSAVSGMVYRIGSQADMEHQFTELANIEGEDYARHRVRIEYEDGSSEWGWTFIWVGDEKELHEGVFDLKDWREHR
ncbi:MAG: hypothetical protein L6R42_008984 [Xanthoria sp. 1 TBL-2021]|nr:MAG: hypothetical protein L6R42_008984 [Xanthoria sp. 1 TBL-2021]